MIGFRKPRREGADRKYREGKDQREARGPGFILVRKEEMACNAKSYGERSNE